MFISRMVKQQLSNLVTKGDLKDLATKEDIANLQTKLETRLEKIDEKFLKLRKLEKIKQVLDR